jgi:integrase
MPLTDQRILRAKPKEKPYKLPDGAGMYVYVTRKGARSFRLKYRHRGKEKLLALGLYPDVSLKRARQKRDDARKLIADGIDPSAQRKADRLANADTFGAIAQEWLGLQKTLKSQTIAVHRARIESMLLPGIGSQRVKDIEAADVLALLRVLESKGTHDTAHRVRSLAGRILRYAVATGRAKRDVTADLKGALAPVVTTNFAAITEPRKIGELLRAIDSYSGQPSTAFALSLAPLLFVRPGELRAARWEEFDLDEAEWRIPAERMKMNREHLVPLSAQAVKLLRSLHALTGDGDLLFPGLRTASRPISENTLNAALRRLGFSEEEMTAHGFRSMASTRLNEMGYHPDLIELQLAHAERNATRAAYNKAQRLEERRRMMQAWADYLDGLRVGGKIIAIKQAG